MFRSVLPHGHARSIQFFAAILVFCLVFSTVRLNRQSPPLSIYDYTEGKIPGTLLNDTADIPPSEEAVYLKEIVRQYGLSNEVPWYSRRIQPDFRAHTRSSMTRARYKFMQDGLQRVPTEDDHLQIHAQKTIRLPVSKSVLPSQANASSLLFGISTSYNRIMYPQASLLSDWAGWLTDGKGRSNGASLVLVLEAAKNSEVKDVSSKLRNLGIDAIVFAKDIHMDLAARYLELVGILAHRNYELTEEGQPSKMLALIEDDVFFPSLGKLVNELQKFDLKKMVYISMPSEHTDWTTEEETTTTYGGGAVFLSPPMAEAVNDLACLQEEITLSAERSRGNAHWDELLYRCVSEYTDEQIHVLPSFYTPEDDMYGIRTSYQGGVQPLTLHHTKYRHAVDAWKSHMVASVCGEDCFLQRFRFKDDWILVNGHTISHYPDGVDVLPLKKTLSLLTQPGREGRQTKVDERLVILELEGGEDRKVVSWSGVKRTWRLLDARTAPNGEVWQAYVKRRGTPIPHNDEDDPIEGDTIHTQEAPWDVDSVIVLIWEPS